MPHDDFTVLQNDARLTREAVIRMEGKLDNSIDKIADQGDTLDDHEARLRELEKSRWPIAQIGMLLSLLAVIAAVLIPFLI
jgi:hypothetical protein